MRELLRLPRCDRRQALLRGHAVSGLCGVCGRVVDPRRTDHHHLARTGRGDHRHAAWLERDTTAPRVSFARHDIPHYWGYAQQYTLCDNYFTDVAGPSTPNHLMLIMADSALIDNPKANYRLSPGPPLFDQPSLPAQLDAAGLSWGNY